MKTVLQLTLLCAVVACGEDAPRLKEISATQFRQVLQCGARNATAKPGCETDREQLLRIESVRIEPTGASSARYVITYRDQGPKGREVVYAEFPGEITNELTAAGIMYSVKPR